MTTRVLLAAARAAWVVTVAAALAACVPAWGQAARGGAASGLEAGFASPPESTKPWCYWYWISDNLSREGITRDLEAMARVGIGQALIGNVDVNQQHRGTVKVLSEEWWSLVEHAIREGGRVGVKVGTFNCPGWSQSGGPWIKPNQTMRHLAFAQGRASGPGRVELKLPAPHAEFQDVVTLAFPEPKCDQDSIALRKPKVTCTPAAAGAEALADGKAETAFAIPPAAGRGQVVVELAVEAPFTARSLTLHPAARPFAVTCELQAANADGAFRTIKQVRVDRTNPGVAVGFWPFAPVAIAFGPVTASRFRLVFTGLHGPGAIAEAELSAAPRLERFAEKQLAKMFQTPLPMWDAYLWDEPPVLDDSGLAIDPAGVVDVSKHLRSDGSLAWDAPAGAWVVLRLGMAPTGVRNAPASPEGTGYEVDKMNRAHVEHHFNSFVGRLLKMPPADRKGLGHIVADSYEMGSQNWTEGLAEDFRKRYGYDPLPYLPVLTGRLVGGADRSERFLWDLRRIVADRVSYDYVGGLRQQCEKHGLRLWLENYGHWGFPGEFLQYGGQTHDLGGEFWATGDLGSIELRAAASAAHVYGKSVVSAEAFTSAGPHWTMDPFFQRRRGDWACTEGINHFVLHVYIHQPDERKPGINAWFGTEFNRHNTLFEHYRGWIDYLRRTHFLLQQGQYVADVAYFIGEDVPKMTGARRPELPGGYSFDYVNAEAILQRVQVKDARWVLPDGASWRLLVLPPLATMRPEVLARLRDLVAQGGCVYGPAPSRSPSMQNFPACDEQVRTLAHELWKDADGARSKAGRAGKGWVFNGLPLAEALAQLQAPPDVVGLNVAQFPWTHRTTPEGELYFISHQGEQAVHVAPSFRVSRRRPEVWDAVAGTFRPLPEFRQEGGRTVVPLVFRPRQSLFVVFRQPIGPDEKGGQGIDAALNFRALTPVVRLENGWKVAFDPKWGAPESVDFDTLSDWTKRGEDGIRHYSGQATYRRSFDLPPGRAGAGLVLDLGQVHNMARVRLNGQDLGVVWADPWRVDISRAVREKDNRLEIDVVNTWANRLIGDQKLPAEQRRTWTVHPGVNAKTPLLPAGLIGPVTVGTTGD